MKRPTIRDLAKESGVSISTVNRVLGGSDSVRNIIVHQVKEAAERIGYYGIGTIRSQIISRKPKLRFGFLLLQPNRSLYKMLGAALQAASQAIETHEIEAQIVFAEDLSPQFFSAKLLELGQNCNAIGVVSAVHPLVTESISKLDKMNVPVFGLISQLSTTGAVNYVGLDNWKVGRQAAWYFHHFCRTPSKIGILVGNHRYRCQEMNEAGFRSYFREFSTDFQLLEPVSTFETGSIAEEMTEKLLEEHPDLAGLYVAGGGITGAMNAIRTCGKSGRLFLLGHDLTEPMRAGLLDGTLTMSISHPLQRMAEATVSGMINAIKAGAGAGNQTIVLPFDTYTRENI